LKDWQQEEIRKAIVSNPDKVRGRLHIAEDHKNGG